MNFSVGALCSRTQSRLGGMSGGKTDFMDTIDTQSLRAHTIIGFDESTIFALRCGSCCRCRCRTAYSFLSNCYYQSIFYLHLNFHLAKCLDEHGERGEIGSRDANLCVGQAVRRTHTHIHCSPHIARADRFEGSREAQEAHLAIARALAYVISIGHSRRLMPFPSMSPSGALQCIINCCYSKQHNAGDRTQKIPARMGNHSAKWRDVGANLFIGANGFHQMFDMLGKQSAT